MDFDIIIIGAGVVGLSIAYELSKVFENLVVIEQHEKFGQETSSRNSEVIHSGVYYPQNSLKAKLCIEGQKLLYEFCQKNNIDFKKCGKFIVATNEQENRKIEHIFIKAQRNGVKFAQIVSKEYLMQIEPNINATRAIFFPDTGIIDSFGLMKCLENKIFQQNGNIVYNTKVVGIKQIKDGYCAEIVDNTGRMEITTKILINAAGLQAHNIFNFLDSSNPQVQYYWKGEYFSIINSKRFKINHLIYPLPTDNAGLGIHTTLDLAGNLRLGPNSFLLENNKLDYKVDENLKIMFYQAAKRYLPALKIEDLQPYQAGIRPKLTNNANEFKDFVIEECSHINLKNFVNLMGIESPGLTSCLAIAKYVRKLLQIKAH